MAEETAEGIAYLKALNKPSGSATSTTPQQEPGADPGVTFGNSKFSQSMNPASFRAEKRRSARYKCEGSIEIQEDGRDVRTWATFTDISVHGCYVEAQVTYPVGTILHLRLEINGMKVECEAASVRVTYPHLGMGIAFVDMPEESRARLRELMMSISRPSIIMGPRNVTTQNTGAQNVLPQNLGLRLITSQSIVGDPNGSHILAEPKAAIDALFAFFETRHMLVREDFLAIIARSQTGPT